MIGLGERQTEPVRPALGHKHKPQGGTNMLASEEQIAAERLALEILRLDETKAIWADVRRELLRDPAFQKPTGAATLERSLTLWTNFLAVREYAGDWARPKILWVVENAVHTWSDFTFPGTGAAGDNPDNIYRSTFIDGNSRYEISGQRPANPATQFSIEVTRGGAGQFVLTPQSSQTPDLGDQVALLPDRDIVFDQNGHFTITLDADPAHGRVNHIQVEAGSQSVNFRDSLSEWHLQPYRLSIRRVAGPDAGPPLTPDDIIERTLEHLPAFLLFWARFKNNWLGAPPVNTLSAPAARDGGWGFLAGGHFDLADDEAIIVTTMRGGALYTGVQVANPWMIANDGSMAITSRNLSQATANRDGSFTYVISNRDPGAPNWIDTNGLHQGIVLIRWQQSPAETDAASLVRDFRIVKIEQVEALLPRNTDKLSALQRAEERRQRTAAYHQRFHF